MEPENQHLSDVFVDYRKKFKGRTVINSKEYKPKEMLKLCYLVMQDVNHQLFCETVEDEIVLGSGDTDELKVQELVENLGYGSLRTDTRCRFRAGRNKELPLLQIDACRKRDIDI